MNIDSTIEDLEAQAYFASQIAKTDDTFSLIVEVELQQTEYETKRLSMALIGLDFVAGFLEAHSQTSTSWVLIPNNSINSILFHAVHLKSLLSNSVPQRLSNPS